MMELNGISLGVRVMETSSSDAFESGRSEAKTDEPSSRRSRRRFRLLLDVGSLALFAIFILRLIPVLLEMDPLNPNWQGRFVDALVDQGLVAFLGFVMLHLAGFIQPSHDGLRQRLQAVRRFAVLAVLGYALLVPLALWSSFSASAKIQTNKSKYLEQGARLVEIREAIQGATNVKDLDIRLQSLLQPALTIEQITQPLPQLKNGLLQDNDVKQEKVNNLLKATLREGDSLGRVFSRLGSSLVWALAFAAGAVPFGSRGTLWEGLRKNSKSDVKSSKARR